jgi:predicted polyphosphate/ATP-dependent NAD kinase
MFTMRTETGSLRMTKRVLGLVVNPIAGIGGAVGLKGSDGPEILAEARARGGSSAAMARTCQALQAFVDVSVEIVTAGGAMGEDACRSLDLPHAVVIQHAGATSAAETRDAVDALIAAGAELILFAGGDGTARDVAGRAGRIPLLGIPAGVKMYSGVFAASATLAGRLAAQFLATAPALQRIAEVDLLDIDEAAIRRDEPNLRFHGSAPVPASPALQRAKTSVPMNDDGQIEALCRHLAARLERDCLYVVGPGRTTRAFMTACSLPKTLLGVDLMRNGQVLAADAGESQILALLDGRPARIVIGLLGGQGCLFGRGNQQISARILRHIERDHILVLGGTSKVATLPQGLFVDTGDAELDRGLAGFIRIETGPGRSTLLRVRSG